MGVCGQCNKELPTKFVTCYGCNSQYHFSPCCSVTEKTYTSMHAERKEDWKCQKCKQRKNSTNSNNAYHVMIGNNPQQINQQKQQRQDDNDDNEDPKRFKDSLSLTDVNKSVNFVKTDIKGLKADVTSMKTDITDIKTTMQQLAINMNHNNNQINTNIQNALDKITNTLVSLSTQVSELCEKNKEKEKQMQVMDNRINSLEQQLINKNIEIKNITTENISPNEVVKKIAASVNLEINESDISNSYYLKKSEKVVVEFTSLIKKRELLNKIKRHRVDSTIINTDESYNNESQQNENGNNNMRSKYIYINDQLTPHNRRLLWLAKTKAKEANWKFVWVKNGNILAKKNEISHPILVHNAADIELITSTI